MVQQKLKYLFRSILNSAQDKTCPNCGNKNLVCIDKKYWVTRLYKCDSCKINFRFPVDNETFLNNFYQQEYKANYSEVTEEITSMPTDKELVEMKNSNFANKRNYTPFVTKLLNSTSGRILDYGTSWGYSVYQLKEAGFDAEGFEISRARAEFGKKINVVIHSSREKVRNDHDLIMSSHAIEHLPVISDFVEFCRKKLGKEGIFMAFCPNGSAEYRKREPYVFHVGWGFLHPNYLDIEFATTCFKHNPYLVLTGDWIFDLNLLQSWDGISQVVGSQRDGHELLVIAKPNVII